MSRDGAEQCSEARHSQGQFRPVWDRSRLDVTGGDRTQQPGGLRDRCCMDSCDSKEAKYGGSLPRNSPLAGSISSA
jgi:hypothetical protein